MQRRQYQLMFTPVAPIQKLEQDGLSSPEIETVNEMKNANFTLHALPEKGGNTSEPGDRPQEIRVASV